MAQGQVEFEGLDELVGKLNAMAGRVQKADVVRDATAAGAGVIRDEANRRMPGSHTVTRARTVSRERATFDIGPDEAHWYYRFKETGATSHEISPKARKALALDKETVIAHARHPGFPAQPFLRPAIIDKQDEARRVAGATFRRIIRQYTE